MNVGSRIYDIFKRNGYNDADCQTLAEVMSQPSEADFSRVEDRLTTVEANIKVLSGRIDTLEQSTNARFDAIEQRFDTMNLRITVLYWVIGL